MTYSLKLSQNTIAIMKNFARIADSLVVRRGNELWTVAQSGATIAIAQIEEEFQSDFAIYELKRFLGILSLHKDPEIIFDEGSATFLEGKRKTSYSLSDIDSIKVTVDRDYVREIDSSVDESDPVIQFDLQWSEIEFANNALSQLGLPYYVIESTKGTIRWGAFDKKNSRSHKSMAEVGRADAEVSAFIQAQNFNPLKSDYLVTAADDIVRLVSHGMTYYFGTDKSE